MDTKRVVLTIRDPGPANAMMTIIDAYQHCCSFFVIVTDGACNYMKDFIAGHKEVTWYFASSCIKKGFVQEQCLAPFATCMHSEESQEYQDLYNAVLRTVKQIKPSICLRGTPVLGWGTDELLAKVAHECGARCYAYQDYPFAGRALGLTEKGSLFDLPDAIGVTSHDAYLDIKQKNPSALVRICGRIEKCGFLRLPNFYENRVAVRERLGCNNKKIVLYCAVKTGDLEEELSHYCAFVRAVKPLVDGGVKAFIRFHPRNTAEEMARYYAISNNVDVFKDSYQSALCCPDIIISAFSAINADALDYQSFFTKDGEQLRLIAMHTDGEWERSVFARLLNNAVNNMYTKYQGYYVVSRLRLREEMQKLLNAKPAFKGSEVVVPSMPEKIEYLFLEDESD